MLNKLVERILRRKLAYRRTFLDQDNNIRPDAEIILADLKRFCRATGSTVMINPISKSIDPLAMAMAEGRREVWNRLMAHLHLEEKTIFNLKEPHDENQQEGF